MLLTREERNAQAVNSDGHKHHERNDGLDRSSEHLLLVGRGTLGRFKLGHGEGGDEDGADANGAEMPAEDSFAECLDVRD